MSTDDDDKLPDHLLPPHLRSRPSGPLTRFLDEHWDEIDPDTQRLFIRFIELLPMVRGDELAHRQLRHGNLSLAEDVAMLERRVALRRRQTR